jgi:hypothetical protein
MLDPDDDASSLESATVPDVPDSTPDVADPSPDVPDESDAPPELRRAFWTLVGLCNAGLLALSLGVMLVAFEGDLARGGPVAALGALLLLAGYRRYRRTKANPPWR